MAAGTSLSKLLDTINAVEEMQKQLADIVKALSLLTSKVELLEIRQANALMPRGE